jgi:hypothetical protein
MAFSLSNLAISIPIMSIKQVNDLEVKKVGGDWTKMMNTRGKKKGYRGTPFLNECFLYINWGHKADHTEVDLKLGIWKILKIIDTKGMVIKETRIFIIIII